MTSAVGGGKGGPPKAEEINKQNQLIYVCDREGGQKIRKFCGCHIRKPLYLEERFLIFFNVIRVRMIFQYNNYSQQFPSFYPTELSCPNITHLTSDIFVNETKVTLGELEKLIASNQVDIGTVDHQGRTCLYMASMVGNSEVVKTLLKHPHVDLNRGTMNGSTYLHITSGNGFTEVVKLLLSYSRVNPNQVNKNYNTALMEASMEGHREVVRLLLSSPRIEVNKVNSEGKSSLILACEEGKTEVVELILRCPQTDIDIYDDNDRSALHLAKTNNLSDIVSLFHNRGSLTRQGHTCCSQSVNEGLQIVAQKGDEEMTRKFLQCLQLDINSSYQSSKNPLYIASTEGHPHVVKVLLDDSRIDVNQMVDGENALLAAGAMGNLQVVNLLLLHSNIDTNIVKHGNLGNALFFASRKGYSAIVKQLLLQPQIEVNGAFGEQQMTGLTAASAIGHLSVVKLFLRCTKTNVTQFDGSGETALERGTKHVKEAIANQAVLLQSHHTCCLTVNEVLLRAARENDYRAIRGLAQCPEANINIGDKKGRTPLYLASMIGHTQAVAELLQQGNIEVNKGRSLDGESPFSIASEKGHFHVMSLLLINKYADVNQGWKAHSWTLQTKSSGLIKPTASHMNTTQNSFPGMK